MTRTFTVKLGKSPDEMTFDECMAHIKRVLFWDYIDGEWCDVEILNDIRWEELAGYIRGAHEREVDTLKAENAKLRELMLEIWRSCPVSENDCAKCPHRIEESDEDWCDIPILMSELGIEVE